MDEVRLSVTGLDAQEKADLYELLKEMGGRPSPNLTTGVTHLIANTVLSDKYLVGETDDNANFAKKQGIPVVLKRWLVDAHRRWKRAPEKFHMEVDAPVDDYELPPFHGLILCATGLSAEIESWTKKLGGTYAKDLGPECTHLIAAPQLPNARSRKVEVAQTLGVRIVAQEWFEECVKRKVCLNHVKFPVREDEPNVDNGNDKPADNFSLPSTTAPRNTTFLAGCNVYLGEGLSDMKRRQFRKIILDGGGSHIQHFSHLVTHYIVAGREATEGDKRLLADPLHRHHARIVRAEWIRDSHMAQKRHPLEEYLVAGAVATDDLLQDMDADNINDTMDVGAFEKGPTVKENRRANSQSALTNEHDSMAGRITVKKHTSFSVPTFNGFDLKKGAMQLSAKTSILQLDDMDESRPSEAFARKSTAMPATTTVSSASSRMPMEEIEEDHTTDLLEGYHFWCSGFSTQHHAILRETIAKHGGEWVVAESDLMLGPKNVVLVPHDKPSLLRTEHTVATDLWLERSLDDNVIHRLDVFPLFRPLEVNVPLAGFDRYLIGVTGFDSLEREHVQKLVTLLGAAFTNQFSKKNTHLVCAKPEGQKYTKAKQWGIPVIDLNWFRNAMEESKSAMVVAQDVSQSASTLPDMSMTEEAPALIAGPSSSASVIARQTHDSISTALSATPKNAQPRINNAAFLNDLTPYAASQEKANALPRPIAAVNTPTNNRRTSSASTLTADGTPLEDLFARNLQHAANAVTVCPPLQAPPATASTNIIDPHSLLSGVRVCTSFKLTHRKSEFRAIVEELGGLFLGDTFDETCTHYIHQSNRVEESFNDFRQARKKRKFIVGPQWLLACKAMMRRMPEGEYPHTMSVAISSLVSGGLVKAMSMDSGRKSVEAAMDASTAVSARQSQPSPSLFSTLINEAITAAKDPGIKRANSMGAPGTPSAIANSSIRSTGHDERQTSLLRVKRGAEVLDEEAANVNHEHVSMAKPQASSQHEPDAGDEVTYDDPESRLARSRIIGGTVDVDHSQTASSDPSKRVKTAHASRLQSRASSNRSTASLAIGDSSMKQQQSLTADADENDDSILSFFRGDRADLQDPFPAADADGNAPPRPPTRTFLLSAMSAEDKAKATSIVERLGGSVRDSSLWEDECTHLVTGTLVRSEKLLAAFASGKWILRPEYLEECARKNAFVDEPVFEWRGTPKMSADDMQLAEAARRWRIKVERMRQELTATTTPAPSTTSAEPPATLQPPGAFHGWTVSCIMGGKSAINEESVARIITAGGGRAIAGKQWKAHIESLTHIFANDAGLALLTKRDQQQLQSRSKSVLCVQLQFMTHFLVNDPTPDIRRYILRADGKKSGNVSNASTPGRR